MASADAFLFVTPEYDYFAPAALVNAVQVLLHEWVYKPAGVLSYGGVSGGLRSAQVLRQLLSNVNVHAVPQVVPVHSFSQFIDDGVFRSQRADRGRGERHARRASQVGPGSQEPSRRAGGRQRAPERRGLTPHNAGPGRGTARPFGAGEGRRRSPPSIHCLGVRRGAQPDPGSPRYHPQAQKTVHLLTLPKGRHAGRLFVWAAFPDYCRGFAIDPGRRSPVPCSARSQSVQVAPHDPDATYGTRRAVAAICRQGRCQRRPSLGRGARLRFRDCQPPRSRLRRHAERVSVRRRPCRAPGRGTPPLSLSSCRPSGRDHTHKVPNRPSFWRLILSATQDCSMGQIAATALGELSDEIVDVVMAEIGVAQIRGRTLEGRSDHAQ